MHLTLTLTSFLHLRDEEVVTLGKMLNSLPGR